MDIERLHPFLDRLADAASDSIMPHFRASLAVENKAAGRFDPVTVADRNAEAAMRHLIASTYPDHGVIGEEYGPDRADADFCWVLDPIDGTRSFIMGMPIWGVLIGLLHHGKPVLGMMAQPFTGERFAGDGRRAWYSGPSGAGGLATRPCRDLGDAAMFTTTPFLFRGAEREAYDRVERGARLARYGSDCYGYAMVAAGNADLVVECGLQNYDVVALIPIIEGAGGRFTDWEGRPATNGGRVVASGDPTLHDKVLARLADG